MLTDGGISVTISMVGRPEHLSLNNGIDLRWRYDINGRMLSKDYALGSNTIKSWSFAYDDNDNIVALNDKLYQYDEFDQIISEQREEETLTSETGFSLSHIYNDVLAVDSFTSFAVPNDSDMLELDYNAGSIGIDFGGTLNGISKVVLTPDSPIHRVDRRSLRILSSQDEYSYETVQNWHVIDRAGTLEIVFPDTVSAHYLKIHCTFDERDYGYVPSGSATFKNNSSQIVSVYVSSETFVRDRIVYDEIGNRETEHVDRFGEATRSYVSSINEQNGRIRHNGVTGAAGSGRYAFIYDQVGNLTEKGECHTGSLEDQFAIDTSQGDHWNYQWDQLNRLTSVSHGGASVSSYVYSARGLRVKKVAGGTNYFIYDQWGNMVYEETGSAYREYLYTFGKHLARVDGIIDGSGVHTDGPTYYMHSNHIGTVETMTDENGEEVWRASYTAFGEVTTVGNTVFQEPIFGGKTYDSDIGLYYFNARWYDASLGRFISEDPAKDGLNWYAYVGNNPLKWTDPTGLRRTREERRRDRGNRRETRQSTRRSNQRRRENRRRAKAIQKGKSKKADRIDGRAARRDNNRFLDRIDNYSMGSDLDSFKGFKNDLVNNLDKWGALEWQNGGVSDGDMLGVKGSAFDVLTSDTQAGINFRRSLRSNRDFAIRVKQTGSNHSQPVKDISIFSEQDDNAIPSGTFGSSVLVELNIHLTGNYRGSSVSKNMASTIAHEVGGHSFFQLNGQNAWFDKPRERKATMIENQYRSLAQGMGESQLRSHYGNWSVSTKIYRNGSVYYD